MDARITRSEVLGIIEKTLAWSAAQDWRGYNKHDGLNSPILRILLGWGKWPRLVAIQGVTRFPVNLRPLLLVPKTRNPKGLALFAQGCFDCYRGKAGDDFLERGLELTRLLLSMQNHDSPGWGYAYPWQDPGFYAPAYTPNAVVTSFVCEAMLDAYELTKDRVYLESVERALLYCTEKLVRLKDTEGELCLSYMPVSMNMRVMDVSILLASVIAGYHQASGKRRFGDMDLRLANYVVNRQTTEGAWFYTDPPGDSHITHDNYHTGFILDAMDRVMRRRSDWRWRDAYIHGLAFYAGRLFNNDGSPRWMSDRNYPHDIHGAAQGILTFARYADDYPGLAESITRWAIKNMYHPDGRFFYQRNRYYTKRFTLLRWCNAWMVRALANWYKQQVASKNAG